jgi:hypothetical protein
VSNRSRSATRCPICRSSFSRIIPFSCRWRRPASKPGGSVRRPIGKP